MRIQDFNPVIKEDNEMSDVITAHGLVNRALNDAEARQEYFDYMTHLRNKHGKEYSTRIHQKATALAKSPTVDEDRNHKIIDAPEGLGGLLFYRKINGVEFRLAKFKNTRGNYVVYVNRKRYDYDTFEEAKAELSQFIKSNKTIDETIKKVGSQYELVSKSGKNLGKYPTRAGAEKREQQVNYFKHVKEDAWTGDNPACNNGNNQWNYGTDQWHSADDGAGGGGSAPTAAGPLTGEIPVKEDFNAQDVVSVDVPLLIRLLEYAREDAKTDMDLHDVTERLIALSQEGNTLTMQDYDTICNTKETD